MGVGWIYNGSEFTEEQIGDNYGFVYVITNIKGNKKYIGKKLFYSARTKQVKGKKKKYKVPSDWQEYYGSNEELKKDIQTQGEGQFIREILHLCKTRGECSYLEAKEQFNRNVMEGDGYYNTWIMVRVHKSHIKDYNAKLTEAAKGSKT